MEDRESPEAAQKRAAQEDPIVMYLIVRESLNMSIGKTAAQCAHAAQMLQLSFNEIKNEMVNMDNLEETFGSLSPNERSSWEQIHPKYTIFDDWINSSFRKVVLKADEKEWSKLKLEFKDVMTLVVDAGLTELEPNTETVIGLWPMHKSQVPKLVKRLQVLK